MISFAVSFSLPSRHMEYLPSGKYNSLRPCDITATPTCTALAANWSLSKFSNIWPLTEQASVSNADLLSLTKSAKRFFVRPQQIITMCKSSWIDFKSLSLVLAVLALHIIFFNIFVCLIQIPIKLRWILTIFSDISIDRFSSGRFSNINAWKTKSDCN